MLATTTLADVRTYLLSAAGPLTADQRTQSVQALDLLGRLLNVGLDTIPADRWLVRRLLAANVERGDRTKWTNLIIDAIKFCPIASKPSYFGSTAVFSPAWKAIDEPIAAAVERGEESDWALTTARHLFAFANALGLSPMDVDNTTLQALLKHHAEIERHRAMPRRKRVSSAIDAARAWNRFALARTSKPWLDEFPPTLLSWEGQKQKCNIQIEEMTPALQAEISRYVAWMREDPRSGENGENDPKDILSESNLLLDKAQNDARPFVQGTTNQNLSAIRLSVTASVEIGGVPLESLVSLSQIAGVAALANAMRLLEARLERKGRSNPESGTRCAMACRLIRLAVYLGLPSQTIDKMRCLIRDHLQPGTYKRRRMSVARRRMLRRLNRPEVITAWLMLPSKLFDRAEALRTTGRITSSSICDVEVAIKCKLIQCLARDRSGIALLRYKGDNPDLILPRDPGGCAAIAVSGKDDHPLPLDEEATMMILVYVTHYRPAWISMYQGSDSDFLFPSKSLTDHRELGHFGTNFSSRLAEAGIPITMQLARQLSAKILLTADRGAVSSVAALLGVSEGAVRKAFLEGDSATATETYQREILQSMSGDDRAFLDNMKRCYSSSPVGYQSHLKQVDRKP